MWFFKFYDSSQGEGAAQSSDHRWRKLQLRMGRRHELDTYGSPPFRSSSWQRNEVQSFQESGCFQTWSGQNPIKHVGSPVCLQGRMCVCLLRHGVRKCCWEVPRLAFHGHVSSHIFTGVYLNRGEPSVFIAFPKTSGKETVPARGASVRVRLDSLWKLPSTPHTSWNQTPQRPPLCSMALSTPFLEAHQALTSRCILIYFTHENLSSQRAGKKPCSFSKNLAK